MSEPPTIVVTAPATGERLGRVPILDGPAVRELVDAARAAQPGWAARPVGERARTLHRFRRLLAENAEEIADLSCAETGKLPVEALMVDVLTTCDLARWYARRVEEVTARRRVPSGWLLTKRAYTEREPYGVIGVIGPWNFPVLNVMRAVMAGLVTGNAVVLKPSEATPLSALRLRELAIEAGFPADTFQVATGDGSTGRALLQAGVDKISFTGSVATGRAVAREAADRLIPLTLELGGKDPILVLEDADPARAARAAANGAFYNAGQICVSLERAYVTAPVYDRFVEELVRATERLRVGPPEQQDADVGAMTLESQVDAVERQVQDAVRRGARVLTGGRRVEGGRFYAPTVLVDVAPDMDVMRHETFGPVLPVMKVADEAHALRLANDSGFALGASVWGRAGADRTAAALRAGMVCINDALVNGAVAALPFGGAAESGYGRVYGDDGLRELTRSRSLLIDRGRLGWEPGRYPLGRFGRERALGLVRLLHGGRAAKVGALWSVLGRSARDRR